ncbi:MAG TPA: phosphatidate cytidylyltransferase [Candidatus Binatia bacterium]|jgi:phosphatidate cytidylyltransferase
MVPNVWWKLVLGNLKSRLITAAVGIPLLVALIGWADWWIFAGIFLLITAVALREYFRMAFPNRVLEQWYGVAFGLLVSLTVLLPQTADRELAFTLVLVLTFSVYLLLRGELQEKLRGLAWTILGGLYLGLILPHWVLLFGFQDGRAWVFFTLIVVMVGDSAAYFGGRYWGRRKLAPVLSPGKTVEGAFAYLGGSIVAAILSNALFLRELNPLEAAVLGICLSVLGQLGDLFESWIKRVFAVKDSGMLLPGHGGMLDRLDSLIFPAVFTTAYVKVFHS